MVYCYTIPRGPVAAMFKSPGPKYGLPTLLGQPNHDPRSVHARGPAYPFGLKLGAQQKSLGPGPAYYLHPKIQIKGPEYAPSYSLASRHLMKDQIRSPGPAAYSRNDYASAPRPPAYTFGAKHHLGSKHYTPGPDHYTLPKLMGRTVDSMKPSAPEYTMGLRPDLSHLNRNPGPGTYRDVSPNVWLNREPTYSMTARTFPPDHRMKVPGPGAHSPEKVTSNRPAPPHYSFGIQHSQYAGTFVGDSGGMDDGQPANCHNVC